MEMEGTLTILGGITISRHGTIQILLGWRQSGAQGVQHLLLHPAPLAQEAPDHRVAALDHKDLLLL